MGTLPRNDESANELYDDSNHPEDFGLVTWTPCQL